MAHASDRSHRKTKGAPNYDDPEFWDVRFATGRDVGEWLNAGDALVDAVLADLDHRTGFEGGAPRVLHLGPGVSKLGPKLRDACVELGLLRIFVIANIIRANIPNRDYE
ncbi:hypothetical protein N7532_004855 [Penicillium argentinense]|uniref:Uncharacterized protein n=1 Tax=Penicillium argentinense TaxID=1131581 RepID=A0A9W9FCY0_9EURO|nr:uncharacterized protein N7532_004855 [Penicillium argentinense]KAJ5097854.1 hypothetical protein N7532_004855 [Penicillium argentinense]